MTYTNDDIRKFAGKAVILESRNKTYQAYLIAEIDYRSIPPSFLFIENIIKHFLYLFDAKEIEKISKTHISNFTYNEAVDDAQDFIRLLKGKATIYSNIGHNILKSSNLSKKAFMNYPHRCPSCGAPSYNGLSRVDCSANCGNQQ